MGVCEAVRAGEFGQGMARILEKDRESIGDNRRLAIELYRLAWGRDRQGIVDLLQQLDRLPKFGDSFDHTAPCQQGVWDSVRSVFGLILPWPPGLGTVHPWHPDVVEAGSLQAELSPPDRTAPAAGDTGTRGDAGWEGGRVGNVVSQAERDGPTAGGRTIVMRAGDGHTTSDTDTSSNRVQLRDNGFSPEQPVEVKAPGVGEPSPQVKPANCALGCEAGTTWRVFVRVRGEWRDHGKLKELSIGKQAELLKLFAEGGGLLEKTTALRYERGHYSPGDVPAMMQRIKSEISNLRTLIRRTFSLPDSVDPLPWEKSSKGWQALIQIGYAVQEDGESLGGEQRLRFKTREELKGLA
jgi:hypothetical protein